MLLYEKCFDTSSLANAEAFFEQTRFLEETRFVGK